MAKRNKEEEKEFVFTHAAKIMETVAKYIHDRPELHAYGMTAFGYAVEFLLGSLHDGDEKGFDEESKEFRMFLEDIHGDVKKLMRPVDSASDMLN